MNLETRQPAVVREIRIAALVRQLSSARGLERMRARRQLVRIGETAVPALIEALASPDPTLRLESAEALLYIGSPLSATALVERLDDTESGVRWLAAEAIIAMKCDGIVPLLAGLTRRAESLWFRQAAHHVLRDHYCEAYRELLIPVLRALEEQMAEDTAPVAAGAALRELTRWTQEEAGAYNARGSAGGES